MSSEVEEFPYENCWMNTSPVYDFYDRKTAHDHVVIVEGRKFFVKEQILSSWSDFFERYFAQKDDSEIEEVKADHFETFLQFIYPSSIEIDANNYTILVDLSFRFMARGVLERCKQFMRREFDKLEKFDLMELAVRHNFEEALDRMKSFIKKQNLATNDATQQTLTNKFLPEIRVRQSTLSDGQRAFILKSLLEQ